MGIWNFCVLWGDAILLKLLLSQNSKLPLLFKSFEAAATAAAVLILRKYTTLESSGALQIYRHTLLF